MQTQNIIIGILIIILLATAAYIFLSDTDIKAPVIPDPNIVATTTPTTGVTKVKVPVFAEGGNVVCGVKTVFIEKTVPNTVAPLTAAFKELFALSEPYSEGGVQYQNPIGYQVTKKESTPLTFDRVTLTSGVASVYLKGSLTGVGTCYDPLPKIQLDETAKQFASVTSVKYYINGKETDPGCIADQKGDKPCYTGAQ